MQPCLRLQRKEDLTCMEHAARENLYPEGKAYFTALINALDQAKNFIDLETYIFELDDTGQRVLNALRRAAKRGVRVRLLVDGFGSWSTIDNLTEQLVSTPVQFQVYHRIFLDSSLFARKALRNLSHRNHRKTCVIDDHSAWIGSFNISDVHTKRVGAHPPWRDTAICIRNTGFSALTEAFERAWDGHNHRVGHPFARQKHFLLNCTHALRKKRNAVLTEHLSRARTRLWVTTPYFSPDHTVLSALRTSAAAGADVRLLLPKQPDVLGMRWINSIFYKRLYRSGLKVFLYQSPVLHAKTILADDWAIVGSSNLNHRSWLNDLEVDAIVTEKHALEELKAQFMRDLGSSQQITINDPRQDSFLTWVLDHFGHWIRHWT